MRVTFDFETRSTCDLKKSGAFKYSMHSTTQPTCLAAKFDSSAQIMFLNFDEINRPWNKVPWSFQHAWRMGITGAYTFSAHNAFFETCIYKNILVKRYGWPDIPFRKFRCTAAKAAACALPRNLEGAGAALNLTTQKDKRGYIAMMKTCKPTRSWANWAKKGGIGPEPQMFLEYDMDPDVWEMLYHYCKIDVKTEELLDQSLPDLIPSEQEIWFLNQKLNWRGLQIDIPTVEKIVSIMAVESKTRLKELDTLTMGLVTKPGARKSILDFLALEGIELPDIRAKTVDDALAGNQLSDDMRRLLEIRKALSKTSTKKYQSFIDRAMPDHKVRDILLYHGASTGRDTGTGIQPHNFPRGVVAIDKDNPYWHVETIGESDHQWLSMLFGETLPMVFSSILRNMIVPSTGKELFVADFSKIEVAVLWWLADNAPGLKILRAGLDPYKYMAAANTGRDYEDITDDSDDRQLGKAQVLGCGFGMGWRKFQTTAFDQYRLKLTDEQSHQAVGKYREQNAAVPALWKNYERAAVAVVQRGEGAFIKIGKCKFLNKNRFLWIELPSGRRLAYREPQINWRMKPYEVLKVRKDQITGEPVLDKDGKPETYIEKGHTGPHETLEFMAVNSKTKKWGLERTWGGTLTENIVQAVARDLMMPAMVRLEKAGYNALLMVHDEALTEKTIGEGSLEAFTKIMCETPTWGEGLPIEAKGWKGPRYRK